MKRINCSRVVNVVLLDLLLVAASVAAQTPAGLSVEWIYIV